MNYIDYIDLFKRLYYILIYIYINIDLWEVKYIKRPSKTPGSPSDTWLSRSTSSWANALVTYRLGMDWLRDVEGKIDRKPSDFMGKNMEIMAKNWQNPMVSSRFSWNQSIDWWLGDNSRVETPN